MAEFQAKLMGWSKTLRFVVIRERLRERKETSGRKLFEMPGYTFRVLATNRTEDPMEVWRAYNGRGCVEQRIEELKGELAVQGFRLKPFWATEVAFLSVLLTFNLLSLYQEATRPGQASMQPATLRTVVFLAGAGREVVVRLSAAWGGLRKHKPLVESALRWQKPTSPKLDPPDALLAIGGCTI